MRKVPLAKNVDARVIARGTPGFSGADLANLVNEAALLAARRDKRLVAMEEFEEAKDKVMMGAERRSLAMTDNEKKLTAYHEAGHAILAVYEPESDPIHKATIVPRGRALGMVMRLPEGDRISLSKAKLEADLVVAMGGRIAEEIIFGRENVTTGASSDIKMATDLARRMVTEWGMSEKLGFIRYAADQEEVFLGHSVTQSKTMSDTTAATVDSEIRTIVENAYNRAYGMIKTHIDGLHIIAKALLEYEMLTGDEIKALLRGETLNRDDDSADPAPRPRASITLSGAGLQPSEVPSA